MTSTQMRPLAVSAFCETFGMMEGSGIQTDDALSLMLEDSGEGELHQTAAAMLELVQQGESFAFAVEHCGCFPEYAVRLIAAGEDAGRLEDVLKNLSVYYQMQDRMIKKLKSAVVYPAILLILMSVVLGVLSAHVLPVFTDVYMGLAGSVAASSHSYIAAANIISRISLTVVVVLAALLLAGFAAYRSEKGRNFLISLFEKFPVSAPASRRIAQAQFLTALATCSSSGMDLDSALDHAAKMIRHRALSEQLELCRQQMAEGRSLTQVIYDNQILEPLYARMLISGARSGKLDEILERLSALLTEDADLRIGRIIDGIEPALAAFLTVSVGMTLLAAMLPLVGILTSIG